MTKKNTIKKRKTQKSTYKRRRMNKVKGGVCPCQGQSLMNGGNSCSPSFNSVPIHSFYSQNLYKDDVIGGQHASRLDIQQPNLQKINGGKKYKTRKNKKTKKQKKIKGGNLMPVTAGVPAFQYSTINSTASSGLSSPLNTVTTTGDLAGSLIGSNIARGHVIDYSNPVLVNKTNIGNGSMA